MNEKTIQTTIDEIAPVLYGKKFGRVFQLTKLTLAIDFNLANSAYLFLSIEPQAPRIYLITRRLRDLEKNRHNLHPFLSLLKKKLSHGVLTAITKDQNERVVRFQLEAFDEIEGIKNYTFVVQMTGRSSNFFLLDEKGTILDSMRDNEGVGQINASLYAAPKREKPNNFDFEVFPQAGFATLSEALDTHYQQVETEKVFGLQAKDLETKLLREIAKNKKLRKKLSDDLISHGDAQAWKKQGDLILANLANAVRIGDTVLLVDYFSENAPTIEIEVDRNISLTQASEKFFKRYTKARNAAHEIEKRMLEIDEVILKLTAQSLILSEAVENGDLSDFIIPESPKKILKLREKPVEIYKGVRRYGSSDTLEILVGKASKDNDHLTFKIAKSLDFWLHAADYGGSHVIVRNPGRLSELPHKTLIEAAELAAFFSKAKEHPKAAVNYTQKKFVNKPKGGVAGLVSLSSFKTILVEPKESLTRK